jgi:hypothetical protein
MNIFNAMVALPDGYLQLTAPSFEFPRRALPASVHFVEAPPIIPNQAPIPPWAHGLDGSRKVVLVTQGTFANHDFGQLVVPALAALANEPDVLVLSPPAAVQSTPYRVRPQWRSRARIYP